MHLQSVMEIPDLQAGRRRGLRVWQATREKLVDDHP